MGNDSGIVVRRTRIEWTRLVRQWQRSGQTAREFGDAHGIRAGTLAWWKWRLGTTESERTSVPSPRLVAVDVIERAAPDGDVTAAEWELTSATGARLRVRGALTGSDLRVVVDALTSQPNARSRR